MLFFSIKKNFPFPLSLFDIISPICYSKADPMLFTSLIFSGFRVEILKSYRNLQKIKIMYNSLLGYEVKIEAHTPHTPEYDCIR